VKALQHKISCAAYFFLKLKHLFFRDSFDEWSANRTAIFCNDSKVVTVPFDLFNTSLLNKNMNFFQMFSSC